MYVRNSTYCCVISISSNHHDDGVRSISSHHLNICAEEALSCVEVHYSMHWTYLVLFMAGSSFSTALASTLDCFSVYLTPPTPCQHTLLSYPLEKHLIVPQLVNQDTYLLSILKTWTSHEDPLQSEFTISIDSWIQHHPWWMILEESKDRVSLFKMNHPQLQTYLQATAKIQFPSDPCENSQLWLRSYPYGWSEYGNEYFNILSNYRESLGAIFDVYAMNVTTSKRIAFLDNDYCPSTLNKWNCAFLPATNCSWPSQATQCGNRLFISIWNCFSLTFASRWI